MKKFCNFKRLIKKYYLLLQRSEDAPHKIALGVAIGLCCGVAIPLGQVILAVILAFIFKANKIFAVAATFISNPYTTPIIYPFFCYLGAKVIRVDLTFSEIEKFIREMLYAFSWYKLFNMGGELLLCYLVGGIITGIIIGITGYFTTYRITLIHRKLKKIKKHVNKKY